MKIKKFFLLLLVLCFLLPAAACAKKPEPTGEHPIVGDLKYESTVPLEYADQFAIYKYEGGYSFIEMVDSDRILVVPEGKEVPEGLDSDVVVVQQPLNDIYLVASDCMALFDTIDALDRIAFVGTQHWYIENAEQAMKDGKFLYAGKYSAPDYEMLIHNGCQLAIENTMILHTPEVKEKLIELGIKAIVERSSYENHPLGRTEWVKFFGALLGLEDEANAAFEAEAEKVKDLEALESTGKTVAFFYVSSSGNVVTYKSGGYLPTMIRIAGGEYIFTDLGSNDSKLSTINMNMEEFYYTAKDADVVIYNCSIASQLHTLQDFFDQSPVLENFKAVSEGNVWCTSRSMFQQTDKMGSIIQEMNKIFTGQTDGSDLEYIFKLQ